METESLTSWQKVWRVAAKLMPFEGLTRLLTALQKDDVQLIQGATTTPPALQSVQDWDCEAACLLAYPGWKGGELDTVGEVEEFFARLCYDIDMELGEPAVCRYLMNWYDDTPRDKMRAALIPEVERSIREREHEANLQAETVAGAGATGVALARGAGRPGADRRSEAPQATESDDPFILPGRVLRSE